MKPIICANCQEDLTAHQGYPRFRIILHDEEMPMSNDHNVLCDVMVYGPLPKPLYFCGIKCLKEFVPVIKDPFTGK